MSVRHRRYLAAINYHATVVAGVLFLLWLGTALPSDLLANLGLLIAGFHILTWRRLPLGQKVQELLVPAYRCRRCRSIWALRLYLRCPTCTTVAERHAFSKCPNRHCRARLADFIVCHRCQATEMI